MTVLRGSECRREGLTPLFDGTLLVDCEVHGEVGRIPESDDEYGAAEALFAKHVASERCHACGRDFQDGDDAYVVEMQFIRIIGSDVRRWVEDVVMCEDCALPHPLGEEDDGCAAS